jgi:KDO2-lipid IV(A) lauroyltransferase
VRNSWRDRLEDASLGALFHLAGRLGRRGTARVGAGIGDLLYDGIGIRRTVALENLRASFPERPESEIQRIARACYRGFATTTLEFARLPAMSPAERLEPCTVVHRDHLEAVAGAGRGAILLTGHFGNWEWFASLLPALGHGVQVVVGEQRNARVGKRIDAMRRAIGVGVLSATHDLRGILQALSRGEFVAIVADQDAGSDGIFVDFLGRPASTAVGPVRMARRFQVPILMGFAVRLEGAGFRMEFVEPFHVPEEGEEAEILRLFTQRWSGILERYVRAHPEQWFWMHRRWKTRPGGAPKQRGEKRP